MQLDDLHLAVVIARKGSLAAASQVLGVSQPTLSKAVARLERRLKVQLFERLARGMRPTEIGRAFLARAESIDLAAGDMLAMLRDLRQARAGVLRVGFGQGVPDHWLLPVVTTLARDGVAVDLTGGMPDLLVPRVAVGDLEFALLGVSGMPGGNLAFEPLKTDPIVPVAPLQHALAQRRAPPSWEELAGCRWVVPPPGTSTRADFDRNFAARGLSVQPLVVSGATQREAKLAIALDALLLLPRSKLDEPSVRAAFVPLQPPGGWRSPRRVGLVYRDGGYLSPSGQRAMKLLRKSVGRNAQGPRGEPPG